MLDDLSVSGDATVWGSDIFIGYTGGDNDRVRFQAGAEQLYWNENNSEFVMIHLKGGDIIKFQPIRDIKSYRV